ncbi:MAG TPA: DUF418 domain-containing protein [Sphingomicrobium sp.]|jgi:uncharacterized protein|nr:DUF418 domain-containing protein [Sphingomicrobium sp.]
MTAVTSGPPRVATLDIVRGIAVMGILAMNIVAFSMPFSAYMNPVAFGMEGPADFLSWLFSFIFVDGKMRGLFSLLFGASMLLVIERAEAKGESAAAVHFRRMAWLFLFGLFHLYFIWFGDILSLYAMIGMVAWLFRRKSPRSLIKWGIAFVVMQMIVFGGLGVGAFALQQAAADPNASADAISRWQELERQFGLIEGQALTDKLALFHGPYTALAGYRLGEHATAPIFALAMFGWETLGYFLFGMAALKTGMLTGGWDNARYRKWAVVGLAISGPAYALLAWLLARDGFSVPMVISIVMAATVPFRPLMVVAYAALIILATRGGGWLVERIAAAGRAAFTNYLGTSIVMTTLFYGYGLGFYGALSRAELWLVVIAAWVVMLAWSKPWLDRYQYGPFEWAWRSLARWQLQPMRKRLAAEAVAAGA